MKKLLYPVVVSIWLPSLAAAADEKSYGQLAIGSTVAASISLMGRPDATQCATTIGVQRCNLTWTPLFSASAYQATFVFDRLVHRSQNCKKCAPAPSVSTNLKESQQ